MHDASSLNIDGIMEATQHFLSSAVLTYRIKSEIQLRQHLVLLRCSTFVLLRTALRKCDIISIAFDYILMSNIQWQYLYANKIQLGLVLQTLIMYIK